MKKKMIVTGSSGLIGSASVLYFAKQGWEVWGIDSNMRKEFFGPRGDVRVTTNQLVRKLGKQFHHVDVDIRNPKIGEMIKELRPNAVIHCAAQPSHDRAAAIPDVDFSVNAVGTHSLLEFCRGSVPESPFVFMSTNKVYGDKPNELDYVELETRYEFLGDYYQCGIDESMSIDQSLHSLFGVSKLSADLLVQEYGRYFGMPTVSFRGGCLTGPNHAGVALHGFLSYLVKANLERIPYTIFGYGGKQVRDQIHALDVAAAFDSFISDPDSAAVYNLGGGYSRAASLVELQTMISERTSIPFATSYEPMNRTGDHRIYYTNMSKFVKRYSTFSMSYSLDNIVDDVLNTATARLS